MATLPFRESRFIDFNSGVVHVPPMELMKAGPQPVPFDTRLLRFEARTEVWFFGPAVEVLKRMEDRPDDSAWAHAGFGLLMLTFSYFEMVGKILNNKSKHRGTSAVDFAVGFRDVYRTFDGSDAEVRAFYDRVRNGLFHLGYTKNGLWIHHQPDKWPEDFCVRFEEGANRYLVNPHQMTRTLLDHFPGLAARIADPGATDIRANFERFCDFFSPR